MQFLGVRGSTPAPGAGFVRYGGHTSCVALTAEGGTHPTLVLDAGTGLRTLTGLLDGAAYDGSIVVSHLHWDHVQGIPFFAAGDREVIRGVLHRLAAMRHHMRKREVLGQHDTTRIDAAGLSADDAHDMYKLLAIANYDDRYVIPQAHAELGQRLMEQQGSCGLDFAGGPGNCGAIAYDSHVDSEAFMLAEEQPTDLDIRELLVRQNAPRDGGTGAGA